MNYQYHGPLLVWLCWFLEHEQCSHIGIQEACIWKQTKKKRTDNTGTIFWCNFWIFRMLSIQSTQLICHISRNLPKLDLCWGFSSCYVSFKTRLVYQQGKVDNGADLIGVREDLEASHDGQEQGRGATANVLCGQWTALMADNRQLDISGSRPTTSSGS